MPRITVNGTPIHEPEGTSLAAHLLGQRSPTPVEPDLPERFHA